MLHGLLGVSCMIPQLSNSFASSPNLLALCISAMANSLSLCNFVLLLHLILLVLLLPYADSVSFNFTRFHSNNISSIIDFQGDAFLSNGVLQVTKNQIDDPLTASTGWATYKHPVPIWDSKTGRLRDFMTHFSFIIRATDNDSFGDGIPFFLAPYSLQIPQNSSGGNVALFTPENASTNDTRTQIVAVEFDSYKNQWDPSADHVGIDVNSIVSVANVTWRSSIKNGSTANAWVSYNSSAKNLSVFLTYANNPRFGGNSTLFHIVDLREILPEEVRIGFSASTGNKIEIHNILSWSFDSTLEMTSNGKDKKDIGLTVGLLVGFGASLCVWFVFFYGLEQKYRWAQARRSV